MSRVNIPGLAVIAAAVALWQVIATVGPLSELRSLPSPTEVVVGFTELIENKDLIEPVVHTVLSAFAATGIGIAIGGFFGLLLGLSKGFRTFTNSSFDVLRTVPVTAIMPVFLLVFGAELRTEIMVASLAAMWPMLVNTADGVRGLHPRLAEVGRMFGFSKVTAVRKLTIPAIMPSLLVGARLAAVTALTAVIVAEMIIVPFGIGWGLISAQNALQTGQQWALVVVCGWLGWLFSVGLTTIVNRLQPEGVR